MLTVYTATHCPVYERTWHLLCQVHQTQPNLPMQIINLDDPNMAWPDFIIGTPTYLWNGQVIFLGNPSQSDLISQLRQMQTS